MTTIPRLAAFVFVCNISALLTSVTDAFLPTRVTLSSSSSRNTSAATTTTTTTSTTFVLARDNDVASNNEDTVWMDDEEQDEEEDDEDEPASIKSSSSSSRWNKLNARIKQRIITEGQARAIANKKKREPVQDKKRREL